MNAHIPLEQPTPQLIEEYSRKFSEYSGGFDEALEQLLRTFPRNESLTDILLKAVAINSLYATNIYDISRVAQRIHVLRIDRRLQVGDLALVEDIARVEMSGGKARRNYSFATKYCAWHKPDIYPIYDYYVDLLLWLYAKQNSFFGADGFRHAELFEQYPTFVRVISTFKDYYSLKQFSLRQIDKFLWLYGKEVYKSSRGDSGG